MIAECPRRMALALRRCFLTFLLLSSALPAWAQRQIEHSGDYTHVAAGVTFAQQVGRFSRNRITSFDAANENIGVTYTHRSAAGETFITIYVYPEPTDGGGRLARDAVSACEREHGSVRGAIEADPRWRNVRLLFSGRASSVDGIPASLTHWSAYSFRATLDNVDQDARSEAVLYCRVRGRWFVKYRITSPLRIDGARALLEFQRAGPWPRQASAAATSSAGRGQPRIASPSAVRPVARNQQTPIVGGSITRNPRVALIVGVSSYRSLATLANPANGARAMAEVLRGRGFDVDLVINPDLQSLTQAVDRFGTRMRSAGAGAAGLFYFAGHGIQAGGINFLIPADARIAAESDLPARAIPVDNVITQMRGAGVSTNIIILDACRNMPVRRAFFESDRGLAQMNAPNGTFISYSTAPGDVAADGAGENSPFTMALVREVSRSSDTIEVLFCNVRRAVLGATEGGQTPWDASSLIEPFYFAPG